MALLPVLSSLGQSPAVKSPAFAVVRINPSPESEADDWGTGVRGRNFWAVHVTLSELICWAYGVSARQIDGGPAWIAAERFDVNGLPDNGGPQPSVEEFRSMVQAALAERFSLKIRPSQKVMPVYLLSPAEGGMRLVATSDSHANPTWGVHRGWLSVTNMTFADVARIMQRTVFDRPVIDRTGTNERYTFTLKWRADMTQFSGMQTADVPDEQGTEDVDDIYTSARRQLGVRIVLKKEPAPGIVIESVSRPSPN